MEGISIIERAFQLAPECASLAELRERLIREGYVNVHSYLDGKHIRDQLFDRLDRMRKKPRGRGKHGPKIPT